MKATYCIGSSRFGLLWVLLLAFALGCSRPEPPKATAAAAPDINLTGLENPADIDLFRAAAGSDPSAIDLRIEQGADVNVTNNLGRTPLFAAAFHGQIETAKALLAKGARLDVRDSSGFTPLHAAVLGGSLGVVQVMAEAGAEVDARSVAGMTPLHLAGATGQIELARALLSKGADKSIRDRQGETPARLAELNRHPATLALLQKAKSGGK